MLSCFILLVCTFILVKLLSLACFRETSPTALENSAVEAPIRRLRGEAATADSARTRVPVTVAASPQTSVSHNLRRSVATLPLSSQAMEAELEDNRVIDAEGARSGPIFLYGHMRMEVPDPQAFLSDTDARNAVLEGISHILGIRSDYISLEASWAGSMLLMSHESAHHIDRSVDLDYSVALQPHHAVSPASLIYMVNSQAAAEISSTIQEELTGAKGHGYIVKVLEHKIAL